MSAVGVCKTIGQEKEAPLLLRVRCDIDGTRRDCRILDLKSGGAFVESFVPAITGSKVSLQFCLPNGHRVQTLGVVSFHQFKVGFGVDFTDLSLADRAQIENLVG